ncbi:MAG: GxxExxY protein [Candidatus Kerfeldbacteria bacterium]|nr:GxxExxY protein [Candidatus Kerfeldbacteria bacterium]
MRTIKGNVIEKDLSYQLVGIFFRIHKELGRFCRERQYGDALERELKTSGLRYERERSYLVGGRFSNRVDFTIEGRIIVDLKAKRFLEENDFFQMKRYLKSASIKLGIIVNFRAKYIHPKRVLNNEVIVTNRS